MTLKVVLTSALCLVFVQSLLASSLAFAGGFEPAGGGTSGTAMGNQEPEVIPPVAAGSTPSAGNSSIDNNYQDCAQDCFLERGNENITLQASYIFKKVSFLRDANDPAAKRAVLGSFCAASEAVDTCSQRYISMNRFWFVKVRGALGKNSTNIAKLRCMRFRSDGTCAELGKPQTVEGPINDETGEPDPVPGDGQKLAQVPYFQKYDQLKNQPNPQQLARVQDGVWEGNLRDLQPNLEDFIRFKKIPRDPEDPSAGEFEVPEVGDRKYDMDAYNRAKKSWQDNMASLIQNTVTTNMNERRNMTALKALDQKAFQRSKAQPYGDPSDTRRLLYNQARGELVDAINQVIRQNGGGGKSQTALHTFPGRSQKSASQNNIPVLDPDKTYTGNEQVVPPAVDTSDPSVNHSSYSINLSPNQLTSPPKGRKTDAQEDLTNPFF